MKKYLALILALVLALSVFACGKKSEEKPAETETVTIPGTWELIEAKADGLTLSAKDLGFEMALIFNENGTAAYVEDGETTDGIDWTLADNVVKTTMYGIDLFDFAFDGQTLTIHDDEENVDLIFKKTSDTQTFAVSAPAEEPTEEPTPEPTEEPTPEPTEEPTPEPTEEPKKEAGIVGKWQMNAMESADQSFDAATLAAFGIEIIFDFREDGTVDITAYGDTVSNTYTFADNVVVVTEESGDTKGVYDPETATIVFEQDGVKLTFVRMDAAAAVEATQAPENTSVGLTAENVVGTWSLTKAKAQGVELPASLLGLEMAFRFNEDGTAAMIYDGDTTEGLNWKLENGVVRLSAYGTDLYDFTFDGTALTIHEESSDTDLIFEKN